jgi:hypothetical protein
MFYAFKFAKGFTLGSVSTPFQDWIRKSNGKSVNTAMKRNRKTAIATS